MCWQSGLPDFSEVMAQTLAKSSPKVTQFPFFICSPTVAQNKQHGVWQSGRWDGAEVTQSQFRNFKLLLSRVF